MELLRALGALAEAPTAETAKLASLLELGEPPSEAEYTDTFLFQLYPYASVYLGGEGMLGGEARDRIAGFWRALGLTPPTEPDHLGVLLAFYAELAASDGLEATPKTQAIRGRAGQVFLWEHLLSWLPTYLAKVAEIAPPFYRRWAALLRDVLQEESQKVSPLERLPLHLREAPSLLAPRETGGEAFVESLLVPVQSGIILTRSDLARAARELDLGLRVGERRFVLKALMAQNGAATLVWLSKECGVWSTRHQKEDRIVGKIAEFWATRAATTRELLQELSKDLE